ncbi:MAG: FG-GAP-like repeat-containing protein [Candidatus Glassbacteria bacterium]
MKKTNAFLYSLLLLLFLGPSFLIPAGDSSEIPDAKWLVAIEAKEGIGTDILISSGINVVKSMGITYFAVAGEADLRRLTEMGLNFKLLDENPYMKEYYVVLLRPGADGSMLRPYSRVLTVQGRYALVESSREEILEALGLGVEIEKLQLETLRPQMDWPRKPPLLEWNGLIQSMVDSISQSSMEGYVDDLVAFGTRRSDTPGGVAAQDYIFDYFQSLGIDSVYLHDFDSNADNVIAVIPGLLNPNQIYVIGAHYDSYSFYPGDAPGADDNASGTAGVMEVARIMSRFFYKKTIIFATWASEEFGLIGSSYWASEAAANGDSILGYLNLDMEGYVESGDIIDLDVISNEPSTPLRDLAFEVAADYVPTLPLVDGYLFGGSSDHASFWNAGYKAIFFFEDSDDYSPYIHTEDDIVGLSLNNFPFMTDIIRVSVALMATMAEPFNVAIFHTPLPNTEDTVEPYEVTARIIGATPLIEDSIFVHYSTGGEFTDIPMEASGPNEYTAFIPPQPNGTLVSYYISAVDSAGNLGTDPWGAPDAVYRFLVQAVDFEDISSSSGTDDTGFGEGVAWGDYDNDDLSDLFVTNYGGENRLYHNEGGGVFTEVGASAGVNDSRTCFGASWGDYDNDGFLDLYVGVRYDYNILYRNEGDGTFSDVTFETGAGGHEAGYTQGVAWCDYDNDGNLDLYVVNRFLENNLYRNQGDGTFTDVAESTGVAAGGTCVSALWADYDRDGFTDLLVTRTGSSRCLLFHNQGDGSFAEVGEASGVTDEADWNGADWGDYDNDGDMDLYVTCSSCRDALYRNEEDGSFTNVSEEAGITIRASTESPDFADFDNDGYLDIHVSSGTRNLLYLNMGDGTFIEVSDIAELGDVSPAEGSAASDVDVDGLMDVYTANTQFIPNVLFRNMNSGNNHITIRLKGTSSNRASIGAEAVLFAGNLSLLRQVQASSGLFSQESLPVEFGLGSETVADSIVIVWPSGKSRRLVNVAANQFLNVSEPGRHPTFKEAVSGW